MLPVIAPSTKRWGPISLRGEDRRDARARQQDAVHALRVARGERRLRFRHQVPGVQVAEVDVGGVDQQQASARLLRGDALEHAAVERGAQLALEAGEEIERRVVRQEEQQPARGRDVERRVAVQLHDALDRLVVAEEGERRDQRAGAHAGDRVELRPRHLARYAPPALQHAGAERAPVAAAGDDQQVEGRARRACFRLRAREHLRDQALRALAARRILRPALGEQVLLLARLPLGRAGAAAQRGGEEDGSDQPHGFRNLVRLPARGYWTLVQHRRGVVRATVA